MADIIFPKWQRRLEKQIALTYEPSIEDVASVKTFNYELVERYPSVTAKLDTAYAFHACARSVTVALLEAWTLAFGAATTVVNGVSCRAVVDQLQHRFPLVDGDPQRVEHENRPSRIVALRKAVNLPNLVVVWAAFDVLLLPCLSVLTHALKVAAGSSTKPPQRRPRAADEDGYITEDILHPLGVFMEGIPAQHCLLEGMHFMGSDELVADVLPPLSESDTLAFQSIVDATNFERSRSLCEARRKLQRSDANEGLCWHSPPMLQPSRLECYVNPFIGFGFASRGMLLNAIHAIHGKDAKPGGAPLSNGHPPLGLMDVDGDIVVMGMGGNVVCNAFVDTFLNPHSPEAMTRVTTYNGQAALEAAVAHKFEFLRQHQRFKIHVVEIEPAVFDVCVDAGLAHSSSLVATAEDLYGGLVGVPSRISFDRSNFVLRSQDVAPCSAATSSVCELIRLVRERIVYHVGVDALAAGPDGTTSVLRGLLQAGHQQTSENMGGGTASFIFLDCYDPVVATMVHPTNVIRMVKPLLKSTGGMLLVNTHVACSGATQTARVAEVASAFQPFAEAFPLLSLAEEGKGVLPHYRVLDSAVLVMRNSGLSQHLVACMRYDSTVGAGALPSELKLLSTFSKETDLTKLTAIIGQAGGRACVGEGDTPAQHVDDVQQLFSQVLAGSRKSPLSGFCPKDVRHLTRDVWGVTKSQLVVCPASLANGGLAERLRVRLFTNL